MFIFQVLQDSYLFLLPSSKMAALENKLKSGSKDLKTLRSYSQFKSSYFNRVIVACIFYNKDQLAGILRLGPVFSANVTVYHD